MRQVGRRGATSVCHPVGGGVGWGGEGCAVGAVQQVAVPEWSPNPSPHSLALPHLVGPGCVCQPSRGAQASDVLHLAAKAMRGQDGRFHVAACLCCLARHRPVSSKTCT